MKTHVSHSLAETEQIAIDWLADVTKKYSDTDAAIVVGLSGHLGAGKTAFVKLVAKNLGIEETVTSPTFVIMKIYPTKHPLFRRLVHIDAYRLERPEELQVLNFEKIVSDKNNLVMVEWPENIAGALSKGYSTISFAIEMEDQNKRTISF